MSIKGKEVTTIVIRQLENIHQIQGQYIEVFQHSLDSTQRHVEEVIQ